jgi:hypothetical protein
MTEHPILNEDDPIWKAIDLGGGQVCDINGIMRELDKAGYTIVSKPRCREEVYPPVPPDDLVGAHAFEGVFDRIVVTQTGVYGRTKEGRWTQLKPLSELPR